MLELWDENTPGCAGICHAIALWGAAEVMALFALAITTVGVILAVRSLHATEKSAADTADSARKRLEHEQAAELQIPYRATGHYEYEIPYGGFLWISNPEGNDTAFVSGRIHNVGRYDAREVKMTVVRSEGEAPQMLDTPPQYLEAGGYVHHFSFQMPVADEESALRSGERVERPTILIQAEYSDGNDRKPSDAKARIWTFRFPNEPLTLGLRARLINQQDISPVLRSE